MTTVHAGIERGILFSTAMVRALLDGSKTQTRRGVTHPIVKDLAKITDFGDGWWGDDHQARCPDGAPEDRLWVREAFAIESTQDYGGDPGIAAPFGPVKVFEDGCYRLIHRCRAVEPDTQLVMTPIYQAVNASTPSSCVVDPSPGSGIRCVLSSFKSGKRVASLFVDYSVDFPGTGALHIEDASIDVRQLACPTSVVGPTAIRFNSHGKDFQSLEYGARPLQTTGLVLRYLTVDPAPRSSVSCDLCTFASRKRLACRFVDHAVGHKFAGAVDVEHTMKSILRGKRCGHRIGPASVFISSHDIAFKNHSLEPGLCALPLALSDGTIVASFVSIRSRFAGVNSTWVSPTNIAFSLDFETYNARGQGFAPKPMSSWDDISIVNVCAVPNVTTLMRQITLRDYWRSGVRRVHFVHQTKKISRIPLITFNPNDLNFARNATKSCIAYAGKQLKSPSALRSIAVRFCPKFRKYLPNAFFTKIWFHRRHSTGHRLHTCGREESHHPHHQNVILSSHFNACSASRPLTRKRTCSLTNSEWDGAVRVSIASGIQALEARKGQP